MTVCNSHGTPLIWTFAFDGAEWFCMKGNHAGPMFGTGRVVDDTPELVNLKKFYNRRWGQIRKYVAAGRYYRKDCKKCEAGEYHILHWTDYEKRRHELAVKKLKEYANG